MSNEESECLWGCWDNLEKPEAIKRKSNGSLHWPFLSPVVLMKQTLSGAYPLILAGMKYYRALESLVQQENISSNTILWVKVMCSQAWKNNYSRDETWILGYSYKIYHCLFVVLPFFFYPLTLTPHTLSQSSCCRVVSTHCLYIHYLIYHSLLCISVGLRWYVSSGGCYFASSLCLSYFTCGADSSIRRAEHGKLSHCIEDWLLWTTADFLWFIN